MLVLGVLGHGEILLILILALLLFGSRLPSVMRSLGRSVNEFKKGMREVEDDVDTTGESEGTRSSGSQPPHHAG